MKQLFISVSAASLLTTLSGCDNNVIVTKPAENNSSKITDTANMAAGNSVNISSSSSTPTINQSNSTPDAPANIENVTVSNVTSVPDVANGTSTPTDNTTNSVASGSFALQVFWGEWVVQKDIASAPVCALGNDDVRQLLGQKLYYSADSVRFEGNVLDHPYYQIQSINASDFFSGYRVSFEQLGISANSIICIHVYPTGDLNDEFYYTNPDTEGAQVFIKDQNTLIMEIGGVYFNLIRSN